ncbi:MAG: helicase [Nitrospinae bacterium]|nr:helicase [Nitrospinota bacterium]
MDLEQRIGRIHRYGQKFTAQVYNLVATDTLEGQIFLLLEEKLHGIAQTLGKVDDHGQVTEDLRAQVLGQLSSRLRYDRLYQEAILDPSLRRTRQEIEVAMTTANLAREVVFELFQDLEQFNLGDYERVDDAGRGMQRLVAFVHRAIRLDGGELRPRSEGLYELILPHTEPLLYTTDRDRALQEDDCHLLGLEHPLVKAWLDRYTDLSPEARALVGQLPGNGSESGVITVWQVIVQGMGGQIHQRVVRLGLTPEGHRSPSLERLSRDLLQGRLDGHASHIGRDQLAALLSGKASDALHRELVHTGALPEGGSYASTLLACVEIVP